MAEYTPHDQLPVGTNTYDASVGMFVSLDREARRETAIKDVIKFWLYEDPDDFLTESKIDQSAQDLLQKLKDIDKS